MSSESDSDDEYLALAKGKKRAAAAKKGAAKKKQKAAKKKRRRGSDSDESSASSTASDSDSDSDSASSEAAKPKRRPATRARQPSPQSDAAESDGDAELERLRKEVESYGDDLYIDDRDRRRLMDMTELERQQILAERDQKKQDYRDRLELRQRFKEKQGAAKSRGFLAETRRGGPEADSPPFPLPGRTSRATNDRTAKSKGLGELKDKRNAKKQGIAYAGGDSDSDNDKKKSAVPKLEISLEQLRSITLRRVELAKWDMFPYFADIVTGCFVRYLLQGSGPNDKQVYRVCRVDDVQEYRRVYKLDNQTGQMSRTGLMLAHGAAKRLFSMDNVSNSPITEDEFRRWEKQMMADKVRFPDADYVDKKLDKLSKQRNRPNTKEEMSEMLQKKQQLRTVPTNLAEARAKLTMEREKAAQAGAADEVEKIDAELARLTELSRSRTAQSSQMDRLAEINKRNRDRDMVRGNRLADTERASMGLSPALGSPGPGLSPALAASPGRQPSPGMSPSPRPAAAPGPPIGIGLVLPGTPALEAANGSGTPAPADDPPVKDEKPEKEKVPPLPTIVVDTGAKMSLETAMAAYKFDDDDLPPPDTEELLI
ncbi:hypothetical protein DFJ74DRAFT_62708 [Hyaloraphidium curvatum]|nr:hypothetical protein DFJ74DRAFT_62708 [Hyaloraphidium curvatum]